MVCVVPRARDLGRDHVQASTERALGADGTRHHRLRRVLGVTARACDVSELLDRGATAIDTGASESRGMTAVSSVDEWRFGGSLIVLRARRRRLVGHG